MKVSLFIDVSSGIVYVLGYVLGYVTVDLPDDWTESRPFCFERRRLHWPKWRIR